MKTKFAFLLTVLAMAVMPIFAQNTKDKMTKMKQSDMLSKMGKPTFEATSGGVNFKVWLMTQDEHKQMMLHNEATKGKKEMEEKGVEVDKDDKDLGVMRKETMAGTHHFMLVLTDVPGKKEISNANAKVLIVSPSKKESSVDLTRMMNHYGSGITLKEKGVYQFTPTVDIAGVTKTIHFTYTVK